jgi:hypothetical protein
MAAGGAEEREMAAGGAEEKKMVAGGAEVREMEEMLRTVGGRNCVLVERHLIRPSQRMHQNSGEVPPEELLVCHVLVCWSTVSPRCNPRSSPTPTFPGRGPPSHHLVCRRERQTWPRPCVGSMRQPPSSPHGREEGGAPTPPCKESHAR